MAETSGYGKRPLWQWVLIYLIIGGIVYFAVYYFFLRAKYNYSPQTQNPPPQPVTRPYSYP